MRSNKAKGADGERLAQTYLVKQGLRILSKNFTTDIGEIDLIATDETTLIFVEVKTRFNTDYGYPAEAVDFRKQKKISLVASQYIKKFGLYDVEARFDVVEVYLSDLSINHIVNAFDGCLNY
ncbi:MAG: YraN family protein [Clostridia bacterium]|nr:YraN family protein [Clostridia bacterium]